jgi:hypothetical protein
MNVVRYDFGQGFEDETAEVHAGMGNDEIGGVDDLVVEEDEVDVDGAGMVGTRPIHSSLLPLTRPIHSLLLPLARHIHSSLLPLTRGGGRRPEGSNISISLTPHPFGELPLARGAAKCCMLTPIIGRHLSSTLSHGLLYPAYNRLEMLKDHSVLESKNPYSIFSKKIFITSQIILSLTFKSIVINVAIKLYRQMQFGAVKVQNVFLYTILASKFVSRQLSVL